jgi:hypothetical protein
MKERDELFDERNRLKNDLEVEKKDRVKDVADK